MSFATEIYSLMTGDPSLNAYADGGIHYDNLIDSWLSNDTVDKWIVYEFDKTQSDCLNSKNVYSTYSLKVVVIQRGDNDEIDIITDRTINYLNNYTGGNIIDIGFVQDAHNMDQQRNIYLNELTFNCVFIET